MVDVYNSVRSCIDIEISYKYPRLKLRSPTQLTWTRLIIGGIMEDALPSVSFGGVGSRFVSQNDLEEAKARRDEQWKAAYARCAAHKTYVTRGLNVPYRLGQEPPPQPVEDSFDGRSLAEVSTTAFALNIPLISNPRRNWPRIGCVASAALHL